MGLPHGADVTTDQVLYNLNRRGIEYDLLPWCSTRVADHGLLANRSGPVDQYTVLEAVAAGHAATRVRWRLPGSFGNRIIAIPKARSRSRYREPRRAGPAPDRPGPRLVGASISAARWAAVARDDLAYEWCAAWTSRRSTSVRTDADAANPFAATHADALQVHPRG